jgi:hypothetical protein
MNPRLAALVMAAALVATGATAQVNEVPMKGAGNDWVKELKLKGRMDWEWIETYSQEVYFATRQDFQRDGDLVTMWTRIEYREPQDPIAHRSTASRDVWDCKAHRKANVNTVFYRWNNLDDNEPQTAVAGLRDWEVVKPDSLGDTLLKFACSLGKEEAR